jgi:hypothetical protein
MSLPIPSAIMLKPQKMSKQGYGHKNVIFKDLKDSLPADEYGAFNMAAGF